MTAEEDLKQKYMQYKMMQSQIEEIQKHIERVQEQEEQFQVTSSALEELKNVEEGSEILVPIANGIFVQGTISNVSELTINVGSNVAVAKSREDTIALILKQHESMRELSQHLINQYQSIAQKMEVLEDELTKAVV